MRSLRSEANCGRGRMYSVQGFEVEAQITLTSSLLFPVLASRSFTALSGGRVTTGESECRNIGIGNFQFLLRIFGQNSHKTGCEGCPGRPIEQRPPDF